MSALKLAFSTLGCPKWSFEEIVKNAQDMGFSAIEVRGVEENVNTEDVWCFRPENQSQAENLLRAYDIRIVGIGTSCFFHDEESYSRSVPEGKTAIDIANRMDIPNIRVFGDSFQPAEEHMVTVQRVIRGIEELCQYAQKTGTVHVLLEIHGDFNTVETLTPVVEALEKYPNFGIIWDIEHSYTSYDQDFRPFYECIKPHIRHTHFKDAYRSKNGERTIVLPGEGRVPIAEIFKALQEDGYDGYYSFEWEKRWHPSLPEPEVAFPHYVAHMKELEKQYK